MIRHIDADPALRTLDPATNYNLWVLFGNLSDGAWVNVKTATVPNSPDFSEILQAINHDRGSLIWMVKHSDERPFEAREGGVA